MCVDVSHLVLESLCDTDDHVVDDGADSTEGSDRLARAMVEFDRNYVGLGVGEGDGKVTEVLGELACTSIRKSTVHVLALASIRTSWALNSDDAGLDANLDCCACVSRTPAIGECVLTNLPLESPGSVLCGCTSFWLRRRRLLVCDLVVGGVVVKKFIQADLCSEKGFADNESWQKFASFALASELMGSSPATLAVSPRGSIYNYFSLDKSRLSPWIGTIYILIVSRFLIIQTVLHVGTKQTNLGSRLDTLQSPSHDYS